MAAQTDTIPAVGRSNNIVDIRAGMLFPLPFRVFGMLFILTGVITTGIEPILSVLLMIVGAGVVTAFEGTEINTENNTYREYYSFLMIRRGSRRNYARIDRLFILSSERVGRIPMATFWRLDKFDGVEFNAYVKFSDGVRVFLFTHRDKAVVTGRLTRIGSTLKVPVVDYTLRSRR